ncbi:hypothetical protein D0962_37530 [Leptolyngbyaceae cyanobacterium CCMR0082]|uniref:Uncharacterized protein n=1 Tax=Adonisia turfae CCMR0082 TaxID=2304604 RepID=A0A6M0SIU1_9CYAN|nr:hypothetical protein [Adonisia turfae]NEZ68365.1 hypothetical protein [Adonisia turfae CCMR0082]
MSDQLSLGFLLVFTSFCIIYIGLFTDRDIFLDLDLSWFKAKFGIGPGNRGNQSPGQPSSKLNLNPKPKRRPSPKRNTKKRRTRSNKRNIRNKNTGSKTDNAAPLENQPTPFYGTDNKSKPRSKKDGDMPF